MNPGNASSRRSGGRWRAAKRACATSPGALTDAMVALLSLEPGNWGQQLARQRTLAALEEALDARWHRILLSESGLETVQWVVVLILSILIPAARAMVYADNRGAAARGWWAPCPMVTGRPRSFLAALRHEGLSAPCLFDGAINGARFLA